MQAVKLIADHIYMIAGHICYITIYVEDTEASGSLDPSQYYCVYICIRLSGMGDTLFNSYLETSTAQDLYHCTTINYSFVCTRPPRKP